MADTPPRSTLQLPPGAPRPLTILVLLADTPTPTVQAVHGGYHDIFTSLFRRSLALAEKELKGEGAPLGRDTTERHELLVESYDVARGVYPTIERVKEADGLLITGSASSAYLPTPWITALVEFTASLPGLSPSLKIFGICFGHQIVARAFGSSVVQNTKGWEIGVRRVELTARGKEIIGGAVMAIQQMHQDIVPSLPDGFELLGSTPVCAVQGMVRIAAPSTPFALSSISIITFQGHPEFSPDIVNTIIDVREAGGVISHELAEESHGYAKEGDDGVRLGRLLLGTLGV